MTAAAHAAGRGAAQRSGICCPWCGGAARAPEPSLPRLAVCTVCAVATTTPSPDAAELEAAYGGWYRPASGRFSGAGDRLLRRSRAALARRLDTISPAGPVLDVGAGDGALVAALRARGREAIGLERSADASAGIQAGEISDFDERAGEWAAVVFWHSLEHLRDPAQAIGRARMLLRPGGVLIVAVPNRTSWQARAFGARWLALDLPRHLTHFSARGLTGGLRGQGFAIERVSFWRGGQVMFGWLHGLVACLSGELDLYDALRRAQARRRALGPARRAVTVAAGLALAPMAAILAMSEILAGAGGTVYVEARRP